MKEASKERRRKEKGRAGKDRKAKQGGRKRKKEINKDNTHQ